MKISFFTPLCVVLALPLAAQSPLGPYQVILDTEMLGSSTPPPVYEAPQPPPQGVTPGWATEYRMSMITKDDHSGLVRIGLQSLRDNRGFLLIEKDESDPEANFRLLSADFERGLATVSHLDRTHQFSLDSGPATVIAPAAPPSPPGRTTPGIQRRRVIIPAPAPSPTPPPPDTAAEEPRFRSQEELTAHLHQVQMDAIRTGKPPLPIPLTPEMDAQLVREGVLPPPGTP